MDHTLREHVVRLEERLQSLRDQLTKTSLTSVEHACLRHEITIAELARKGYMEAFELERKIA